MEPILVMEGISKYFPGVKALDNVRLDLYPGEVLALLGENGAGKSTLMKVLLGIYQPDAGQITYRGKAVSFHSPHDALAQGISMIHQEIRLVSSLDVAENIWLGRESKFETMGLLRPAKRREAAQTLLDDIGIRIDAGTTVARLSIANMQLVEIARAVSYDPDVIIMDEPTSALTDAETELLFHLIRRLTEQGKSIIYISHKMDEIFAIADRMTVMRDGQYIDTCRKGERKPQELINMIAGRELNEMFPKEPAEIGDVILEATGLCGGAFTDVSFQLHCGEILGFCGLVGAGRSEIMRAIFGLDRLECGSIRLEGKEVRIHSPKDAIELGIGMVMEDRLRQGSIHRLSVQSNMSLAYLRSIANGLGLVNMSQESKDCQEQIDALDIALASKSQPIGSLSGGNQQKVIFGRWLLTHPKVLIMDEPTRGIDVGAKANIHRLLCKLAQSGVGIILISSEMPEILGMSDRIYVVHQGRLVYECSREEANQVTLTEKAFGLNT